MPAHRASESARQADSATALPASRGGEVIHPQAVTLVHQQLDLLASSVFRWNGHAWPDVPMSWTVEEEQQARSEAREGAVAEEEGARRWSTTVSLELPKLGEVDLRLSLDGQAVQARFSGLPQPSQNFAVASFSVPHEGQTMRSAPMPSAPIVSRIVGVTSPAT